ncbi:MAG: AAC(3) family N-acetyltransferase, partial [Chloroflexota bacterium]|nr:AAC(3) family N-acetyltransferase [Chloroflexota bacterium]
IQSAPIVEGGVRLWKRYQDVDWNGEAFTELGAAFDETGQTKIGKVGSADARYFPQRVAVDFATHWLRDRRVGPQP